MPFLFSTSLPFLNAQEFEPCLDLSLSLFAACMNESTRMRLRSGAVLDLGSSCSEVARDTNTDSEMDRQDDSLSIEAQWGTPLTTR